MGGFIVVHEVKNGKTSRMSFSKMDEIAQAPNLIEVQKNSYDWFVTEGFKEVVDEIGINLHGKGKQQAEHRCRPTECTAVI